MPTPDEFYTAEARKLQAEHDSLNLANAVVGAIVSDDLQEEMIGFIKSRDYFFLSTVDPDGSPTVSYKGGAPGFVRVLSPTRLLFPSYDGNGMFISMGNIAATRKIGMLFIDMVTPNRVRVQGNCVLTRDPELMAHYPGANMICDVEVTSAFVNCARYIHKHQRIEQSQYVPDGQGHQPFPAWKRIDAIQPALPARDQGQAEKHGGTITDEEYAEKLAKGTS